MKVFAFIRVKYPKMSALLFIYIDGSAQIGDVGSQIWDSLRNNVPILGTES